MMFQAAIECGIASFLATNLPDNHTHRIVFTIGLSVIMFFNGAIWEKEK